MTDSSSPNAGHGDFFGTDLSSLIAIARRRHRFFAELDARLREINGAMKAGRMSLPAKIVISNPDGAGEIGFIVWDRKSWLIAHRSASR